MKVDEAKAFIAFDAAQQQFLAAKEAWRADRSDKKKDAAYRKALADFTPKVAAYRAARQAPAGAGDGTASPAAFAAKTKEK